MSASCTPYACNALGCLTTCAIDLDCAMGWVCRKGVCAREGTSCTSDLLASIDKDGKVTQCAPYKCSTDGTCGSACATSDDCSGGAICDTNSKTCAAPAAGDSGGGCTTSRTARFPGWIALLVLVCARRRRYLN
jgi:hypothetical protein